MIYIPEFARSTGRFLREHLPMTSASTVLIGTTGAATYVATGDIEHLMGGVVGGAALGALGDGSLRIHDYVVDRFSSER